MNGAAGRRISALAGFDANCGIAFGGGILMGRGEGTVFPFPSPQAQPRGSPCFRASAPRVQHAEARAFAALGWRTTTVRHKICADRATIALDDECLPDALLCTAREVPAPLEDPATAALMEERAA